MKIIKTISEIQKFSNDAHKRARTIGFVPTMGFFHKGHLSLIKEARDKSDLAVVSIFVNPAQFGRGEDYEAYPRDLKRDDKLASQIGVDVIFAPEVQQMYPEGYLTFVDVGKISEILEGASRPGHFRGVTTVVTKLFNIVKPDLAFFGQKDYQQAVIIKRMVEDLNMDIRIVVLPTQREPDGLAMSSRNTYLSPRERKAAPVLFRSLMRARDMIEKGQRKSKKIMEGIKEEVASEELIRLEYVAVCDPGTLEEVNEIRKDVLIAIAAKIGKTWLIDNIIVGTPLFNEK